MSVEGNFQQAIEDGVLIDVSHVASPVGILCPTFVTSAFWESVEIGRSEKRLAGMLERSLPVRRNLREGQFGQESFLVHGGPDCRWGIGATALVDSFPGFGTVVVVGDFEEDLDFRSPRTQAGGSFYTN